jgi:hypothetical protein
VLQHLLSTCYQASLLREETRPVTFRLALGEPDLFAAKAGPPAGLHRLIFSPSRPFDEHELRRLTPAAGFHRSLIAARLEGDDIQIWGLLHSGPRWLQSVRGGRDIQQAIPALPMVAVTGPGRMLVSQGTRTLAALAGGSLISAAMDVFSAHWLIAALAVGRETKRAAENSPRWWESSDPAVSSLLTQHVLRRIVATIREARHGGTLILVPHGRSLEKTLRGDHIALKYLFKNEEPRRRVMSLIVEIVNELRRLHTAAGLPGPASWDNYEASDAPRLAVLDEALFEVAHLIAALAQVDGAVVMTTQLELLGFGGEISGSLPDVVHVRRALNIEGTSYSSERTDRAGTRHRSVYRLCEHAHDAVGIIVSHDGGVRFSRSHRGHVTYWDQIATGPWEV